MIECCCIQKTLPPRHPQNETPEKSDVTFANLVYSGKIHSAARYLSSSPSRGVLRINDTDASSGRSVRDMLLEKHPPSANPPAAVLLPGEIPTLHNAFFHRLTPALLKSTVSTMHGSAGSSGLNADAWKRLTTCFKTTSNKQCEALARSAKRSRVPI